MANGIAGQLKKMDVFLSEGNLQGFSIEAHGLKGSFANIGAIHNSELAAELEIAAKADNIRLCTNKFATFADIVESFANELKIIFQPVQNSVKPIGSKNFLMLEVKKAIELLNNFEAEDALKCLNELVKFTFDDETDTILNNAKNICMDFEYDKALSILKTIENLPYFSVYDGKNNEI